MRACLAALLVLASTARAEDWDALVQAAASESPETSREAIEILRRAGPEADAALERASSADQPGAAGIAGLLISARRWDPEARLREIQALRGLDGASKQEAASILAAISGAGSWRGEAVVRRILALRPPGDRADLLRVVAAAPGRDIGWADVGVSWLRDGDPAVRAAAAEVLDMHGSWRHAAELRLAVPLESDPVVLRALWHALVVSARGPEDLPALPEAPDLFQTVLDFMSDEVRRARMTCAAWHAWQVRQGPSPPYSFCYDIYRLARLVGSNLVSQNVDLSEDAWGVLGLLAETVLDSPRPHRRTRLLQVPITSGADFCRAATLLEDPSEHVRLAAAEALADQLEAWGDEGPPERIRKLRTLAAAGRIALEASSGAVAHQETAWAVKELLKAGQAGSRLGRLVLHLLDGMREEAMELLGELREDPDLGAAASNARRVLFLELSPDLVDFEDGLQSRPWLDWYQSEVRWDRWREMAQSNDEEDRWYAAAVVPSAVDSLEHRGEALDLLLRLCEDDSADVAKAALDYAVWCFPDRAPPAEELRLGEAWTRPRTYVRPRLKARVMSLAPLDHEAVRAILERGDRQTVLSAARADRFSLAYLRDYLAQQSQEPGLLPVLLDRLGDLGVESWTSWCACMANSGREGCRMLAAIARTADLKQRGPAIASLLSVPWGADFAVEPLDALTAMDDVRAQEALVEGLRGGGRGRSLSRPAADAVARAILALARRGATFSTLHSLAMSLGQSTLANASPELLARMTARSDIVDAAINGRAWIGPMEGLPDIARHSSSYVRSMVQDLYPGTPLSRLRLHIRTWLDTGSYREPLDPWRFGANREEIVTLLLDEAANDEGNREILLDALRKVNAYSYARQEPSSAPSVRPVPFPLHAAFRSDSEEQRLVPVKSSPALPVAEVEGLLAAALRGAPGDHLALDAAAPRLGPDTVPLLVPLLGRDDPAIRSSAACAIAKAAGPARAFAAAALAAAAERETHATARLRFLAALARLGDPASEERLRLAAASADADERLQAIHALAACPSRAGAFILASLADDFDAVVRAESARTLAGITGAREGMDAPSLQRAEAWKRWLESNPASGIVDPAPSWVHDLTRNDF